MKVPALTATVGKLIKKNLVQTRWRWGHVGIVNRLQHRLKVLKIKTFFMYVCFDGALLHGCISQDVVRRPVLEATSLSFFANYCTIPNFP